MQVSWQLHCLALDIGNYGYAARSSKEAKLRRQVRSQVQLGNERRENARARLEMIARPNGRNPDGVVGLVERSTQGSRVAATLGWRSKSRWDLPTRRQHAARESQSAFTSRRFEVENFARHIPNKSLGTRLWGFPTLNRFNDSTIQRFNDSTIQRFNDSTIQRFNDSAIQRFNDSTIQRFSDSTL